MRWVVANVQTVLLLWIKSRCKHRTVFTEAALLADHNPRSSKRVRTGYAVNFNVLQGTEKCMRLSASPAPTMTRAPLIRRTVERRCEVWRGRVWFI